MVKVLKLVSGEEVIGEAELKDNAWEIKNPVRLLLHKDGAAMVPISPFIDEETKLLSISNNHVVYACDVNNDVKNAYNTQYGTGVILPPTGFSIE